jgi:DNA-binding response OmpR family regulator
LATDPPRILLVDDNEQLLHVLRSSLEQEGYQVAVAADGQQALDRAAAWRPDVIVLDAVMPNLDGWAACERLRQVCDAPIIFLSALRADADVVRGLVLGAEDYLTKPFSLAVLKARIDTQLRRRERDGRSPVAYRDAVLEIDLERQRVTRNGRLVPLSAKELQLLACLVRNRDSVVSHDRLLAEVWGEGYEEERAYLTIYIRYLRQKLEDDPSAPAYVCTVYGKGYVFRSAGGHSDR